MTLGEQGSSPRCLERFIQTEQIAGTVCQIVKWLRPVRIIQWQNSGFYQYNSIFSKLNCRTCDSQNLNVSPFCILGQSPEPVRWADDVKNMYVENVPGYIEALVSPMRDRYYTEKMTNDNMMKISKEV